MSIFIVSKRSDSLSGIITVPGDKSISHRALIFGALSSGTTKIHGLLVSQDVTNTANALTSLGVPSEIINNTWHINGVGTGGFIQPTTATLDFGNSGTGVRLMLGALAGHDITVTCVGDKSLSRRPLQRVTAPLKQMGLTVDSSCNTLPVTVTGTTELLPIEYTLPVPSAQVKSAILIAGLQARGTTCVIENEATRDHTERMLRYFGAKIETKCKNGRTSISVDGYTELTGREVWIPGDPSSAAFLIAAATIVPGSDLTLNNILYNPTRTGFYQSLLEMGADITLKNKRELGGEPVVDIRVRSSKLKGIIVPPERAPSMIDEYPILAVTAAFAAGTTVMQGLDELKVKESNRLSATAAGLVANGVDANIYDATLTVIGTQSVLGGGLVTTNLDHRIAMAFSILGLGALNAVTIDDGSVLATSFPDFCSVVRSIGGNIETVWSSS
ncbi:MAG: 3-phosphoshikimate 1-carboxyvinyltransferase [Hyphomicrobiaceae bacterium]|nr:3-phosphoshikimate 1-carboxyvinyltransferase [Hyphomicrobiaceae bacterium]